jgi:hypothetical protein
MSTPLCPHASGLAFAARNCAECLKLRAHREYIRTQLAERRRKAEFDAYNERDIAAQERLADALEALVLWHASQRVGPEIGRDAAIAITDKIRARVESEGK